MAAGGVIQAIGSFLGGVKDKVEGAVENLGQANQDNQPGKGVSGIIDAVSNWFQKRKERRNTPGEMGVQFQAPNDPTKWILVGLAGVGLLITIIGIAKRN